MIFWIFVILFIIGIIGYLGFASDYEHNGLCNLSFVVAITCGIVSLIMSVFVIDAHVGVDGRIEQYRAHYEAIVYQYENDIYDNDNDLGKRELMVEINSWNEAVAYKQEVQDDFWIGIFYPNIYDQFEQIPLKGE